MSAIELTWQDDTEEKITSRDIDALGKIFAAEINNRLPFQSKAKIYEPLVERGFVVKVSEQDIMNPQRLPPVMIEGYALTHKGRMAYCLCC